MSATLQLAEAALSEAGYTVSRLGAQDQPAMVFENSTVLGFGIEFETVANLIDQWEAAVTQLVTHHQMGLRRSGAKAWNAYALLLTHEEAGDAVRPVLNTIEEDLVGLRKIVRDGINSPTSAVRALLPLLPFLRSPELPTIDMEEEIRLRTGGIPADALTAFFSSASEPVTLQVIEET